MNSWFHMPFAEGARFELISECEQRDMWVYYYIDYDEFDELEDGLGRFHAQWRRANPTPGIEEDGLSNDEFQFGGTNLSGEDNYTILSATGRGHYVGCVLNVVNLRETTEGNWYGEGDDMIFVDGEGFPPSLHGTGTEDYVNAAWCPSEAYSAPYHGITLPGGPNWSGQISMYRFHIEDPVPFRESIRVTIEHGHANRRSDDLSSVAYWYQQLPHEPFGLAQVADRLPEDVPGQSISRGGPASGPTPRPARSSSRAGAPSARSTSGTWTYGAVRVWCSRRPRPFRRRGQVVGRTIRVLCDSPRPSSRCLSGTASEDLPCR